MTAAVIPSAGPVTNRIDVFFRDASKCLQHYQGTDRGQDFVKASLAVPGPCDADFDGPMTAVAWDAPGRIDLFWFSGFVNVPGQPRPALMHRWTDGAHWYKETLETTGTTPASPPTVASSSGNKLDIFWRDTNNQVRWLGFNRTQKGKPGFTPGGWFSQERAATSNVTGDVTVVERTTNVINLFWTTPTGQLMHEYSGNGGSSWSGALNVGQASSAPSATSWGTSRLDVVYGVDPKHLGHLSIDGASGTWNPHTESLLSAQARSSVRPPPPRPPVTTVGSMSSRPRRQGA